MKNFGILFFVLFSFFVEISFSRSGETFGTVYYDLQSKTTTFKPNYEDPSGVAWGIVKNDLFDDGWDKLRIVTTQKTKYSDDIRAYCAGYLEACLTYERIFQYYENVRHFMWKNDTDYKMPSHIADYFTKQKKWIESITAEKSETDIFYHHVKIVYLQLLGIIDGYNMMASSHPDIPQISYEEFQVIASAGDLYDLVFLKKEDRIDITKMSYNEIVDHIRKHTHCSALFKLENGYDDLFFGHNTWFELGRMGNRMYKTYEFYFDGITSHTISFPGYPGKPNSLDDFYVTYPQYLVVIETTNNIFNTSLYDKLTPESLSYWYRVMIANRISKNGEEWMKYFSMHNSGTYNNQWMVLDLKKWKKGAIEDGAFHVGEQIPGYIHWEDQTNTLRLGYWPSFNIPFYKDIWILSGYKYASEQYPQFAHIFSHDTNSRAKIFRRDHHKVTDIESFKKILRYNDYENDQYSYNEVTKIMDPGESLASRADLNPLKPACHGAYDVKASSAQKYLKDATLFLINGPTHDVDYIPVFDWRNSTKACDPDKFLHIGQPDSYSFDWIEVVGWT